MSDFSSFIYQENITIVPSLYTQLLISHLKYKKHIIQHHTMV